MFPGGGGGGGGLYFFSACVGSCPSSNFHPQKYQEFRAPKNIVPEPTFKRKYQIPPPPPWGVFLHSYTRCPSESDKTGVMRIATKERDIDNDVIVYIVIGDAYQIFQQTLSVNNHRVDSLNISMISGYLVYLYTLNVFHRKLTFYCEKNVTGVTIPG